LFIVVFLAGCEVGPNYRAPNVTVMNDWGEQGPQATTQPAGGDMARWSRAVSHGGAPVEWWTTFHDSMLDDLIARATETNLDLKRAAVRVREARAERAVVRADQFPQVNVGGTYEHARVSQNGLASAFGGGSSSASSPPVNPGGNGSSAPGANGSPAIPGASIGEIDLYQAGFDASWELDIFGGHRRAFEAATADLQAAEENRHDVLLSVLGETARNYVELRSLQRRLAIVHENWDSQIATLRITKEQANRGLTSELDVNRATAQVATTAAQIPALESSIGEAIHRLSILLDQQPTALVAELSKQQPLPPVPDEVPIGLPADLVRRRPDIRRAERQIAAQTARVGIATADLYPKFSLNGSAGLQSTEPGDLLNWSSRFYSIGPSVSWPIFDAGRNRARLSAAQAREQDAMLAFRQTVLIAMREVEDALLAYGKSQEQAKALRTAVSANERSVAIARDLYKQGVGDFLSVLDAQRSLFASQDASAQAEAQVDLNLVALYKALGGGWEADALNQMQQSPLEVRTTK
jgi:NodT family efflux transporter outer membrane factor (OMF) lipoprotein